MTSRLLQQVSRKGAQSLSLYKNIASAKRAESTIPYNNTKVKTLKLMV